MFFPGIPLFCASSIAAVKFFCCCLHTPGTPVTDNQQWRGVLKIWRLGTSFDDFHNIKLALATKTSLAAMKLKLDFTQTSFPDGKCD